MNILISIGEKFETKSIKNYLYNDNHHDDAYINFKYPNKAFIVTTFKQNDHGHQDGLYTFKIKKSTKS